MSNLTVSNIINFTYFKEVADGDPEAYTDLLQLVFIQQTESFAVLRETSQNGDYTLLEITAHKMKAIAALMGLSEQRQQLAELEEAATSNLSIKKINLLIKQTHQLWKLAAQELQNELAASSKK